MEVAFDGGVLGGAVHAPDLTVICVTQRAVFGFHAAKAIDQYGREYPAPVVTRVVAAAYLAPMRNWIKLHGGLTRAPFSWRT
jgi:hypothetical protein